ncbi:alpha/beta-hydrolase, partial [Mycena sanguinolenta]
MDHTNYKKTKTKRGFTYSYYFSAPAPGKPVLFFSHGFPSASFLWRKEVTFFQPLGYGIIVPDHLGYGEDMGDILDAEAVATVAVGHDWGSYLVSRMIHYIPQRISAVAFCDVGYVPAEPGNNFLSQSEALKKMIGYDAFAYQRFFIQADAAAIIEKNINSFISLIYPEKPEAWKENMCIDGGARAWVEGNTITASPSYLTPEDTETIRTSLLSGGLTGPLCWYKGQLEQANIDEDASASHGTYAKGPVTRKEIDADHWGPMSHAAEVNEMLLEWLGTLS